MSDKAIVEREGWPSAVKRLTRERDEARQCARQLFRLFRRELDVENWLQHEPWLKETSGSEAPAGG